MKKKWHFKKWFQNLLGIITFVDFMLVIGISDVEHSAAGYLTILAMLAIMGLNINLLSRYGEYGE